MRVIYGLGRFMLGSFFLYSGFNHLTHVDELAGYAAAKNTPSPRFDVEASGVLLLAAGASVAFGLKPRLGAAGAAAFLAVATPVFHDFWAQSDPQQRQNDMIHFSKNVALLGSAIALLGAEGNQSVSAG
jgi:putative oxidoreductase